MATVFPIGQSAPLYTIGSTITVIVMMMLAQLAFTVRTGKTESVGISAENPYKWAAWRTFAFVGLAYGFCIYWWVETPGPWNFKIVWVTSSVVIASAPILAELPLYMRSIFSEDFYRVHFVVGTEMLKFDSAAVQAAMQARKYISYRGFLYALNYISLAVLILMSILCLYILPDQVYASTTYPNTPRAAILATGVAIFVVLMVDLGAKSFTFMKVAPPLASSQDSGEASSTATEGLINTMIANKRAQVVDLKSLQVNTPPGKFANAAPISFARTQGLAYPRDAPENMLAHKIENQLIRPDTKTTFGIKDYQIIQTNPAQAIIVSSKDGNNLMNVVPGGTLNFERHGFLGPVNKGDDENLNVGEKEIQKVMDKEGERIEKAPHTNRFFFRIFDHEPPILGFQNQVMGIGKGNGLWINTPGMLPMFLTLYFLAVEMQIWRNEGAGLIAAFITLAPCFCFAYMGHERQYLQLFWLNRLLGYFVIVTQRSFPYQNGTYTSAYLMNSTLIGDNSTIWVHNSTLVSPSQVVAVEFTTYLALAYVCLWIAFFVLKCGFIKPNGEAREPLLKRST
jgi:hypothetical protein